MVKNGFFKKRGYILSIVSVVIVAIVLFVAFLSTSIYNAVTLPSYNGCDISGEIVDNDYNNYLAGANLVRIGDKLYFNYEKSDLFDFCHGLMEISNKESERLLYQGYILNPLTINSPIRKYNDMLLIGETVYTEELCYFSPLTQEIKAFESINGNHIETVCYQYQEDFLVQLHGKGKDDAYIQWEYKGRSGIINEIDGKPFRLSSNVYISNHKIYMCTFFYEDDVQWTAIWEYDVEKNVFRQLYKIKQHSIYGMIIEDDMFVLNGINSNTGERTILCVTKDGTSNIIATAEEELFLNAYNGMIYIAGVKGVTSYNLKTGEYLELYNEKAVSECYIVDNTWVYFLRDTDGRRFPNTLYRIKQDGTCFEKVYG